jgi:polar amino acid transport system permease protein
VTIDEPATGFTERVSLASARVPWRVKLTAVYVVIAAVLVWLFWAGGFDVAWIRAHAEFVFKGLTFTIVLAIGAIALACVMALIGSLCRLSKNPVLFGLAGFYTSFFRGTPLIVQLFLIYLALPQLAIGFDNQSLETALTLTAFQAALLGLGLNYGAYMTEIFRAGIQSVSGGQWEAAEALGMRYTQRMRRIILPQAIRVIIPPTGNEFIAMIKDTALVSVLGVAVAQAEVFRRAQLVGQADFKTLEAFILAAGIYWGLTAIFTFFQTKLERRLSKGYDRNVQAQVPRKSRWFGGGRDSGSAVPVSGIGPEIGTQGH